MINPFKTEKSIGLSLGGGATLGSAHIGVLRAIDELNIEVSQISGTSIGALIGALYAFGKTWKDMQEMAVELDWYDISELSLSKFGLLSNKKMGKILKKHIGDVRFDEANIPLYMVATDIATGERIVMNEGSVAEAVKASACIPGVFIPVNRDGRMLVDGGIVENVPVSVIKDKVDLCIGVDLNTGGPKAQPKNIIDVLVNSFQFIVQNTTKLQTMNTDILLRPDLSKYNMVKTGHSEKLIEIGYSNAMEVLSQHFKD